MTRKEALFYDEYDASFDIPAVYVEEKINKIFDYFESQTCKNCEWYVYDTYFKSDAKTCAANMMAQSVVSFPPEDFGCNKFKQRK